MLLGYRIGFRIEAQSCVTCRTERGSRSSSVLPFPVHYSLPAMVHASPSKLARTIANLRLELQSRHTRGSNPRQLRRTELQERKDRLQRILTERALTVTAPSHKKRAATKKAAQRTSPSSKNVWPARRRRACAGIWCCGGLLKLRPRWFVPALHSVSAPNRAKRFLSVFGGVGHGCSYLRKRRWQTALVDIADNEYNDMTHSDAKADCRKLLKTSDGAGFDVCCRSLSTARRAPLGSTLPNQVRSKQHPWGLPNLKQADAKMVREANDMVRFTASCVRKLALTNKPGYVENPLSSHLWKILKALLHDLFEANLVFLKRADFCQYGTKYKKPTQLLVWGPKAATVQLRCCRARGPCLRTRREHEQLTCVDGVETENGCFKTPKAQEYPPAFIADLLRQLL